MLTVSQQMGRLEVQNGPNLSRFIRDIDTGKTVIAYRPVQPRQIQGGHEPRLWFWAVGFSAPDAPQSLGYRSFSDLYASVANSISHDTF